MRNYDCANRVCRVGSTSGESRVESVCVYCLIADRMCRQRAATRSARHRNRAVQGTTSTECSFISIKFRLVGWYIRLITMYGILFHLIHAILRHLPVERWHLQRQGMSEHVTDLSERVRALPVFYSSFPAHTHKLAPLDCNNMKCGVSSDYNCVAI